MYVYLCVWEYMSVIALYSATVLEKPESTLSINSVTHVISLAFTYTHAYTRTSTQCINLAILGGVCECMPVFVNTTMSTLAFIQPFSLTTLQLKNDQRKKIEKKKLKLCNKSLRKQNLFLLPLFAPSNSQGEHSKMPDMREKLF